MSNLVSIQLEKHCISGLIQNQNAFAEVEAFLNERDFCAKPHDVIYSCIKSSLLANEKIDKVILAQKIKNLGITFKDDLNIFDYIDAITYAPITYKATIEYAKELVKLRVLRDMSETCGQIQSHIKKSVNDPLDKTISEIDAIYGQQINAFTTESGEVSLYGDLLELAEERGNNPITEIGLQTPFPEFNRLYGGLRNKNLYFILARAKAGKSTVLEELGSGISEINNVEVLYLDSELSTEEVKFRAAASKSGVPLWYIETGNWRKVPDYVKKIRETLKAAKTKYKVSHYHIGNKSIEQVASICRRWHLKKVGRGNKCLIIYDYVKMVNEGGTRAEHQQLGDKVDFLKKLAEELDCPILTAGQTNRTGITTNKKVSDLSDDEGVAAGSDRILWYASGVWHLRRKVTEEIALDTPESGTHLLQELVVRFQGKDAKGHQDLIKRIFPGGESKYVKNYINILIENFKVTEKGSLKDSIDRQNAQHHIVDPQDPNHHHQKPL